MEMGHGQDIPLNIATAREDGPLQDFELTVVLKSPCRMKDGIPPWGKSSRFRTEIYIFENAATAQCRGPAILRQIASSSVWLDVTQPPLNVAQAPKKRVGLSMACFEHPNKANERETENFKPGRQFSIFHSWIYGRDRVWNRNLQRILFHSREKWNSYYTFEDLSNTFDLIGSAQSTCCSHRNATISSLVP